HRRRPHRGPGRRRRAGRRRARRAGRAGALPGGGGRSPDPRVAGQRRHRRAPGDGVRGPRRGGPLRRPMRGGGRAPALLACPRAGARSLIDRAGGRRPVTAAWREPLGLMLAGALLPLARAVTAIGLALVPARAPSARRGRTALLIPLLPDLSHTFVYREALEVLRRHPDWEAYVLERGDDRVVHREAAELARRATPVPVLGPAAYLWSYLRHWLTRPRAMAGL